MDDSFFRLGAAHHAEEAAYRSTLFTTTSGLPTHPRIRSGRAGPHFPEVLYSHAHTPGFISRATGHYYLVRHAVRHHSRFRSKHVWWPVPEPVFQTYYLPGWSLHLDNRYSCTRPDPCPPEGDQARYRLSSRCGPSSGRRATL